MATPRCTSSSSFLECKKLLDLVLPGRRTAAGLRRLLRESHETAERHQWRRQLVRLWAAERAAAGDEVTATRLGWMRLVDRHRLDVMLAQDGLAEVNRRIHGLEACLARGGPCDCRRYSQRSIRILRGKVASRQRRRDRLVQKLADLAGSPPPTYREYVRSTDRLLDQLKELSGRGHGESDADRTLLL